MNKLIYVLEFPLVRHDIFTLYHLYSIPIPHPDSSLYSTILPEQTYIATSTTRQQYVITNSLDSCKTFAPNTAVCKLIVYNVNSRPICEMSILSTTSRNVPENCEVATFSAHIDTFQKLKSNQWIFILSRNTPYALECSDKTTHGAISGTGIISLQRGCKLYTALATLSAEESKTLNISHPIITVDLETLCIQDHIDIEKSPELIPIKINNIPLDSLKTIKEEIKIHSEKLNENESFIDRKISKFSYLTFLIGFLLLILMCLKCCNLNPLNIFCKKPPHRNDGCIQIFNNCFDRSQRRQHIQLPMVSLNTTTATSCAISEDEEGEDIALPTATSQKLGNTAQSLF